MDDFELGVISYNKKNYKLAKECFTRVLEKDPSNITIYHNLGVTCIQLNENQESLKYFEISCKNNYSDSFISRGAAYRNLEQYNLALSDFATAFVLNPHNSVAYSNYSNTLREFGKPDIALEFIKIANKLKPDNTSLLNESITYLALGDLIEGWKKYEYRWFYETGESLKPNLPGPEYNGTQSLNGLTVLVYHEQGFGDCIQFARYITLLENLNAKVILLSKLKLAKLMQYNYPNINVIEWGNDVPEYNYHVALLDLPKCFNTSINNIPSPTKYLSVNNDSIQQWNKILGEKTKPRIGLTWTSNGVAFNTKFRKINLKDLVNIVSNDYEFINLHFDPTTEEIEILKKYNIKNVNEHLGDFYSTAGLISTLDCVITVDTVTAHLSGALGINTLVMLPNYGCDWRWFMDRTDSPFYNSVKLFRKKNENWNSVIEDIKSYLKSNI